MLLTQHFRLLFFIYLSILYVAGKNKRKMAAELIRLKDEHKAMKGWFILFLDYYP